MVAYDFGTKLNILRLLAERGCEVTVVPAQTSAAEVLAMHPDGVFLSNGPGDPAACDYAIAATRTLARRAGSRCSASAWATSSWALALGGKTLKMKFGHHGANHPVKDLDDRTGADHLAEPRLCRGSGNAAGQRARDPQLAVRRHAAGLRADRPAGVLFPGPSGSEPGPARRWLPVRPFRAH